ncbi:MAG: T9SS type A sorting domain-containing protein [Chitinophagales bacterium]
MKKKVLVLVFVVTVLAGSYAQSIERQVIGSSGGYSVQTNISASYTVGETVIQTAAAGTILLTQGFQQPDNQTVGIVDVVNNIQISAYPNPTTDKVIVEINAEAESQFSFQVFNALGQLVLLPTSLQQTGRVAVHQFDFSLLSPASYFIAINSNHLHFTKTIQITKTN